MKLRVLLTIGSAWLLYVAVMATDAVVPDTFRWTLGVITLLTLAAGLHIERKAYARHVAA